MTAGFTLRPLATGDLDAIARVHAAAARAAYAYRGWDYTLDQVRDWYSERRRHWDWGLVAESGGAVVGFAAATGAFLDQLFVLPAWQGRGVGRALLAAVLARGLRPVTLHTSQGNARARAFYERHGFRATGSRPDENGEDIDIIYAFVDPVPPAGPPRSEKPPVREQEP